MLVQKHTCNRGKKKDNGYMAEKREYFLKSFYATAIHNQTHRIPSDLCRCTVNGIVSVMVKKKGDSHVRSVSDTDVEIGTWVVAVQRSQVRTHCM